MKYLRNLGGRLKYLLTSLTLSMRRRISFDYTFMYVLISLMTLSVFAVGYNLVDFSEEKAELTEEVYHLSLLFEKASLTSDEYLERLNYLGEEHQVGIAVQRINAKMERSDFITPAYDQGIYDARYIENIWVFFKEGLIKGRETMTYTDETGQINTLEIQVVRSFLVKDEKLRKLMLSIFVAQIIGVTLMSLVGSYRLKRVFMPIFLMTKTAEKLTLNDMNIKLDVSRAEYELKDLAMTFNDMIERIRDDYVKQKRFVSDVSHELRTPISIVNGYARMLDRWGKSDEAILEESIEAIKSESRNMQVLVENLLTLVRSDNQTLKFEKEQFDVGGLLEEIVKDMTLIDEGKHGFELLLPGAIQVCLDYSKLKQTVRIFLDNAIKYTPQGGRIKVILKERGEMIQISVTDTGIGVSKDDLPHLFERFYRSDESRTRETGGHGLGLAIAKAMIIGQGGRIRVKSKEGEGSEFIILLPKSCEESKAGVEA